MLRNSHPKYIHRTNKYMDNLDDVKTWVDMEPMETSNPSEVNDYSDIDLERPSSQLASEYHSNNNNTNSMISASEKEIEGVYCESMIFLYRNRDESNMHLSCGNYVWRCHKCRVCLKMRRLDIMNKLVSKLDHHSSIDREDLYHLIIKEYREQGLNPSKITKRLKYLDINSMLMYSIDEKSDTITYLLEGPPNVFNDLLNYNETIVKVSFDYAISHFGLEDKYRFLGKFFAKLPSVNFKGLSKEELQELEEQEHYKNDRCGCGDLYILHTMRKATAYQLAKVIKPEDHYEDGFNEFNKVHLSHLFYED